MRRVLISGFLCSALLLGGLSARAQQPPDGSGTQPSAAPQGPAAAKPPAAADQQAPERSDQTIVRNINLVDVLFTVLNRRNKLVPDLEKENFKVLDNGTQQSIRFFSRQTDLPLRIGMLLDTSNSIRDRIKFEQDAATNFLYSVLRRNKDAAFVMTFDDEPQIIQAFTGEADKLRDQIVSTRAGGGTAIYDAIYEACEKQLSHPPRPPGDQPDVVRRVMILISDGEDNLSNHTRAEAIEMAQRFSVVIYAISTSTQWVSLSQTDPNKMGDRKPLKTEGDQILEDLAEETGGRAFFPYHVDDLDQSFQDIGDELRNQYSIAYSPLNYVANGKYHKIRIETPDHKGYQVRARRGYYARTYRDITGAPEQNPAGSANQ